MCCPSLDHYCTQCWPTSWQTPVLLVIMWQGHSHNKVSVMIVFYPNLDQYKFHDIWAFKVMLHLGNIKWAPLVHKYCSDSLSSNSCIVRNNQRMECTTSVIRPPHYSDLVKEVPNTVCAYYTRLKFSILFIFNIIIHSILLHSLSLPLFFK